MEQERWNRIERLYHSAREKQPGERDAFLKEACAGDESLRREVESLLGCRPEAEEFIESPARRSTRFIGLSKAASRSSLIRQIPESRETG